MALQTIPNTPCCAICAILSYIVSLRVNLCTDQVPRIVRNFTGAFSLDPHFCVNPVVPSVHDHVLVDRWSYLKSLTMYRLFAWSPTNTLRTPEVSVEYGCPFDRTFFL